MTGEGLIRKYREKSFTAKKKGLDIFPDPLISMVGDTGIEVSDLLHLKQIPPHFRGAGHLLMLSYLIVDVSRLEYQ